MNERWLTGSFTKNYSWGTINDGLVRLHESINVGFQNSVVDVSRTEFRSRIQRLKRPDFIPINFFFFNYVLDGDNFLLADELVFQAVNFPHSRSFDRLALHALNNSHAGRWKGMTAGQDRPSLWAQYYIRRRVASQLKWDTSHVGVDDIEAFLKSSPEYTGATTRKLSSNLAYIYRVGGLREFASGKIEKWWTGALFLTLDRATKGFQVGDHASQGVSSLLSALHDAAFIELAGRQSLAKKMALPHLCELYEACGQLIRFSPDSVRELENAKLGDVSEYANSDEPIDVTYRKDVSLIKSIPRVCAMLAYSVGFEKLTDEELDTPSTVDFVKVRTKRAIASLESKGIRPTMSAADLIRLTRGE